MTAKPLMVMGTASDVGKNGNLGVKQLVKGNGRRNVALPRLCPCR
jgi:hypothetical protein